MELVLAGCQTRTRREDPATPPIGCASRSLASLSIADNGIFQSLEDANLLNLKPYWRVASSMHISVFENVTVWPSAVS